MEREEKKIAVNEKIKGTENAHTKINEPVLIKNKKFVCPDDYIKEEIFSEHDLIVDDDDVELYLMQTSVNLDLTRLNDAMLPLNSEGLIKLAGENGTSHTLKTAVVNFKQDGVNQLNLLLGNEKGALYPIAKKSFRGHISIMEDLPIPQHDGSLKSPPKKNNCSLQSKQKSFHSDSNTGDQVDVHEISNRDLFKQKSKKVQKKSKPIKRKKELKSTQGPKNKKFARETS